MMIALTAAIAGAVAYGVGSVLQAFAAQHATAAAVVRHPAYLLGIGCDMFGFAASIIALRDLPLFAVQAVLAASLGVTVVLARVALGTHIRGRDGAAILVVVGALIVLALASGTQSAQPSPTWFTPGALLAMSGAAALLLSHYRRGSATALAMLAGTSFAGSAVGARALDLHAGLGAALLHPIAWTIAGFGLVGSLAYARSLERGTAGSSTAIVWVVEVVVSGLIGITVLGDHVLAGWELPALGAMCMAILGCVALAGAQPATPGALDSHPHAPVGMIA